MPSPAEVADSWRALCNTVIYEGKPPAPRDEPVAAVPVRRASACVEISPDYRYARVRMRLRPWNRNYFGTHFGGSLFAMTDPFWVLLLFHQLCRRARGVGPGRRDRVRRARPRHRLRRVPADRRARRARCCEQTRSGEKALDLVRHGRRRAGWDRDRSGDASRSTRGASATSSSRMREAFGARLRRRAGLPEHGVASACRRGTSPTRSRPPTNGGGAGRTPRRRSTTRSRRLATAFGRLIGVPATSVALRRHGVAVRVAGRAALPRRSKVLVVDGEFTSVTLPFVAAGHEIVSTVDECDLVAVSVVQSADGRIADLESCGRPASRCCWTCRRRPGGCRCRWRGPISWSASPTSG